VTLNPGKDFEVVAVSFDPADTPEIAAAKKKSYLRVIPPDSANGWHFLTGDEANIKALTDAIGFHYKYDAATDQFAHASAIMILTPEGRLSKYSMAWNTRRAISGWVCGGFGQQDRHACRPDSAVLFSLRPASGKYGAMTMNCCEPLARFRSDLRNFSRDRSPPGEPLA